MEVDANPFSVGFLGGFYAKSGDLEQARQSLEDLDRQRKEGRYVCPYEVATIYIALGEVEEAFKWLNVALVERSDCIPWLQADERLEPLRSDPRFSDLLRRAGFPVPEQTLSDARANARPIEKISVD